MRKEKGITLIALVITIVVLLILSGVVLNSMQQSGIIGKSKEAEEKYGQASINEEETLNEYLRAIPGGGPVKYYRFSSGETKDCRIGISSDHVYFYEATGKYLGDYVDEYGYAIGQLINSSIKVKYNGKIYTCSTVISMVTEDEERIEEGRFFETSKGKLSTTDPLFISDDGSMIVCDPTNYYINASDEEVIGEIDDRDVAILDTSFNPQN